MFRNPFSQNFYQSKTSFFRVKSNEIFPLDEVYGSGSINDTVEGIGYPKNHIRIIHTFDSDKISCLGFKTLSKELILVLARNSDVRICLSDIRAVIKEINWDFEYSSLNIEEMLNEGIELQNFDIDFLKSVIDLKNDKGSLYRSEQLGLYFQFEEGILKAFSSSEWDNSSTKWLKNLNEPMVQQMYEEAYQYHANEVDAMLEVNMQTDAILNIPNAVNNEFVPLHRKSSGNINFYNLLLAHYNHDCSLNDFLFVNRGRYFQIAPKTYEVEKFIYEFDFYDELVGVKGR
jgi:hypothetical protein